MRRPTHVVVISAVVILAACGGGSDMGRPQQGDTEATGGRGSEGEPGTFEERDVLEPGTYVADTFDPPFTFSITGGCAIASSKQAGFLDLGLVARDPPFRLIVHAVREVFDPESEAFVPAPDDLMAWLTRNPMVETNVSGEVTIGGIAAVRMDVSPGSTLHSGAGCLAADPCAPLFRAEEGQPLHIHDDPSQDFLQAPLRLFVLSDQDRPFVFAVDTEAELDEVTPAAEALLETIAF